MRIRFVQSVAVALVAIATVFVLAPGPSVAEAARRTTTTRATTTTTTTTSTTTGSTTTAVAGVRCVVRLHGKGGDGFATFTSASGWKEVGPRGNATGWGGYQWLYFPEASYAAASAVVSNAIAAAGCTRVVIDGFSNGAAFAAKLACRGATFGGTVVGYVIDDPVPDHGTDGCARTTHAVLYWTGALAGTAVAGWPCANGDWTCEGGETIGIDAAAANLRLAITPSVNRTHRAYANPPELALWLA